MTIVSVTYDHKKHCIDCIADSRLSSGESVLTDLGPKVLPLHVHAVNFFDPDDQENVTRYKHTFGFAYSGSMLSAMSTYGWLAGTLNQLLPRANDGHDTAVDSEAIALYCAEVATQTVVDTASRQAGTVNDSSTKLFFEAYIFGFCIYSKSFRCFHIFPNAPDDALKYQHIEINLQPKTPHSQQFHAIGSGAARLLELATSRTSGSIFEAVRSIIDEHDAKDVGGGLQIATAFESNFTLTAVLEGPVENTKQYWLGKEVTNTTVDDHGLFLSGIRFHNFGE